jgi:hypothetical protein
MFCKLIELEFTVLLNLILNNVSLILLNDKIKVSITKLFIF